MNQPISKKEKMDVIDWLIEYFPNAFFRKANEVKPLQIGIYDELIHFFNRLESPPFSNKILKGGLSYYSASPGYLKCQKEGAARVDLYGNEIDVVTADQAKYAHQRYQLRYASTPKHQSNNKLID
jgi:ProP effector